MKSWLTYTQVVGILRDGYKGSVEENGSCSASGVLWGWLVGFYGISTTMGHLMPNPVHIY